MNDAPSMPTTTPALLDVNEVAARLGCSTRHVYRLADAGKMPPPIKLGALCRWIAAEIDQWIEQGCPSVRRGRRGEKL